MPETDNPLPPKPVAARGVVILGGAHGALTLARSLGNAGIAARYVSNDSPLAAWSRHVGKMQPWPGADSPQQAVPFLLDFARTYDLQDALLVPAGDAEVRLVSQFKRELSAVFRIMLPGWEHLQWLCDKPFLYRRAAELGLSVPKTYALLSVDQALVLEPEFPLVLKPNMGGGNSALARAKIVRADDRETFIRTFSENADKTGAENIVVQQLIPGGGECQFSYAALWSGGHPVAEFCARRGRQYPVDFGFTSTFVETVDMPEMIAASRTLLQSARFEGLVEIEFKRDPRNGLLNILDVNPRPWSWFGLCAAAGIDLGRTMWDVASGRAPSSPAAPRRAAWMYLARDMIAAAISMARGELKPADYIASFRHVRAWAAFSMRDPLPGLIDFPLTAFRVVTRRIFRLPENLGAMPRLQALKAPLKYGLIRVGLEITANPLVRRMFPQAAGRGVIFTLHHVRPACEDGFQPNALLSVTPEFLEEAIWAAIESGLTPVHLHDLPALLADPSERRNFVAFTLDDGYRDNAEFAAPVFRKFGIPYTIFVSPGFVERKRSMWWETAAALAGKTSAFAFDFGNGPETIRCADTAGKLAAFDRLAAFVRTIDEDEAVRRIDEAARRHHIGPMAIVDELVMDATQLRNLAADPLAHFGAHTVNHVNLRRVGPERLQREIADSMALIETYTGQRPRSFSYPYGWSTAVGDRAAAAVASAGIPVAVTTQPGVLTMQRLAKPTELPRVSLNGYYQQKRYVKALISGIPFWLTKGQ